MIKLVAPTTITLNNEYTFVVSEINVLKATVHGLTPLADQSVHRLRRTQFISERGSGTQLSVEKVVAILFAIQTLLSL